MKFGVWNKIVQIAGRAAKSMGLDLEFSRTLCSQLLSYRNNESPFDQPYTHGMDDPIKWWTSMELEPPYLQEFALRIFSICPNSASCERGFSMCGWITNKRRLRLKAERLESITKIISYYRSNAPEELGFYGKATKRDSEALSHSEILAIVNDKLAKPDEEEDNGDETEERRTTDGHVVPNNQVIVLIEKTINLLHPTITSGLGELDEDDNLGELDEDDNNGANNNDDDNGASNNNDDDDGASNNDGNDRDEEIGRGVMDFNIEDLSTEFMIDE